jgi:hypothetical protein
LTRHTKGWALMDQCTQSGYEVFATGKFVKFDVAGSGKAKDLIEKSIREKTFR